jgi:hypothetical protein
MGSAACCRSKSKINPIIKVLSTDGYATHYDLDLIFIDFKQFLLNTGISLLPMNSNSLQKFFETRIQISKQNIIQDFPDTVKYTSNFLKNLQLCEAKCRGLEVYLRYLNDYKSLILLRELKTKYSQEFIKGMTEKTMILNNYYKEIRGSYTLQGYSELVTVLKAENLNQMNHIIEMQYQEEVNKLRARYKAIERFNVIDDEVYLKTLGSDVH